MLLICQVIVWVNAGQIWVLGDALWLPLMAGPLVGAIITAVLYWGNTTRKQQEVQAALQAADPDVIVVQQNPATRVVAKPGLIVAIVVGAVAVLFALLAVLVLIAFFISPAPFDF